MGAVSPNEGEKVSETDSVSILRFIISEPWSYFIIYNTDYSQVSLMHNTLNCRVQFLISI